MIIVLEGTDRAGKSTLARFLEHELKSKTSYNVKRLHRGPIRHDAVMEYVVPLAEKQLGDVWILDRWHVGELVYGPMLRGESKLTMPQLRYIELLLTTMGVVRIHVSASLDTLKERFVDIGDKLVDWHQLEQAWIAYNKLFMFDVPGYTQVYTDVFPPPINFGWIYAKISDGHATAPYYDAGIPRRYVGTMKPRVLLLGDQQGQGPSARRYTVPWPFVPALATSGHWLMESLIAADVPIPEIGMVNGNELRPSDLSSLWKYLDTPPVVALGANAFDAATEAGLPVATRLNHPQYERRFHFHDQEPYGRRIKEVMRDVQ